MPPRGSRTSSRARLTNRSDQRTERADSVALLVCSDTDHLTTLVIGTVNLEQTVKKGEDLTSDNYVGKPDEPETTEGTVTDQPKEEEQLQSALKSAGRGYENAVVMSSNVTLTDNLTIPSGVCLRMNGCTLNASIYKINLEHEAAINVESQSKLYVGAKNIVLGNDENDFCYAVFFQQSFRKPRRRVCCKLGLSRKSLYFQSPTAGQVLLFLSASLQNHIRSPLNYRCSPC